MPFLYALLAAWLTASAGALGLAWLFLRRLGSPAPAETEPPACVIAPVKGVGPHLAAFVGRLRGLDYPEYRIVAVVESEADPAFSALGALARSPGAPLAVEVAGLSTDEGQKVHNLRHALARLGERDRIVALVDADTLPSPDWLRRLVRPLMREPDIVAVTGYRWIVPDDDSWASAAVAAANCSVLTLPRPWDICWGGSLAFRRETVDAIDMQERLRGAVVDDVHLTRVFRDLGLRVFSPRSLIVASPARHDWLSAARFGRRQYQFIRWYLPGIWSLATGLLMLPILGCIVAICLCLTGNAVGPLALGAAVLIGQARASLRFRIASAVRSAEPAITYARQSFADRWLVPLWTVLHAACALSAVVSRRMWWAGTLYEFVTPTLTRVIRRTDPIPIAAAPEV